MTPPDPGGRDRRRGSAIVLAVLVAAALSLLGIAMLFVGETEGRIAENEHHAAGARLAAGAAARVVKLWFDDPDAPPGEGPPPPEVVDRSRRRIEEDGDPATPPHAQDGLAWPRYKQDVDRNGDGRDDLFDRPWGDGLRDALLGTPDGPDMRIDEAAGPLAEAFLRDLSRRLLGPRPLAERGVETRIRRIDVHGPPWVVVGGAKVRRGIATIRVVAAVGGPRGDTARATVVTVIDDVPYASVATGPLRSCGELRWRGRLDARWGTVVAVGSALAGAGHRAWASSWPRVPPAAPGSDLLWGHDDDVAFRAYLRELELRREVIEDPWFRYLTAAAPFGAAAGRQPFPFTWDPRAGAPPGDGEWPNHLHPGQDGDHSNLFQLVERLECDGPDYELWKAVATSGERRVRYYVWEAADRFRENGSGPARSFREITDGEEGLFFFDTTNGRAPEDTDGDGVADNLTPAIDVEGGRFGLRGFVFLNASVLRLRDLAGRPVRIRAPGEPFRDGNGDGRRGPGEAWVNLAYPRDLAGPLVVDALDNLQDDGRFAGDPVRNSHGPAFDGDAAVAGILVTAGGFEARGGVRVYGAVVAGSVAGDGAAAGDAPSFLWDASILRGWPPAGWDVPRTMTISWDAGPGRGSP